MYIKLEQYRIFNAVAAAGSISGAAENLYMTQSAVSQTIKQLENSLDTTLFVRSSRGVALTAEGEMLHSYSLQALQTLNAAEARLRSMKALNEGELRIGASDTISDHYLLPVLEEFHRMYPRIRIQVVNRVTSEAAVMVKAGKIDIGFGNLPFEDDRLCIEPCMQVHDIFVAGSAFRTSEELTDEQIAALPLILLEKTSSTRNNLDSYFLSRGITLTPEIELGAHELLLKFASINLGVSCVIKEFSERYLDGEVLSQINMKTPLPARHIGFFYQKNFFLSPAAKKFIDLL